ncbi:MAG: response regulator FixJ [Asticcacaulis sp.]|uniref:response regulator FixJ n=1 Tax=Asticcacaulis sp. TaxID=1872648 RepID=UPI003F7B9043
MTGRVIHIVDDEAPVRASLAFMLVSAGFTVKAHDSARAFLAASWKPDEVCLLTDLRMPDMDGLELLTEIRRRGIDAPSIVLTGHGDVPMAVAAMKAGASDFIEKPYSEATIIDAIHAVCARFDAHSKTGLGVAPADVRHRLRQLTSREREILEGVVAGLPNKTIAYDLEISPRTVEAHRASIMAKMQARSLPELVRMTLAVDLNADNGDPDRNRN